MSSKTEETVGVSWLALGIFNVYRLGLSLILLVLNLLGGWKSLFNVHDPHLFLGVCITYLILSIVGLIFSIKRLFEFQTQVVVSFGLDIILLVLLMRASPGLANFFGILINVAIAGGSLLTAGRISLLFASIATIALLVEHFALRGASVIASMGYSAVSVLGATSFATAIVGHLFSRRLRESEIIAHQQAIALQKLQRLSEYAIRQLHAGVIVVDEEQRVQLMNDAARYYLKLEKNPHNVPLITLNARLGEQLKLWLEHPRLVMDSFSLQDHSTEITPQFLRIEAGGTLLILDDTRRVLQQAQHMKLISLGRLTASIAHEIRNPLAAISHATQLLAETTHLPPAEARLLEIIRHNTERVNIVVKNVLQLSRQGRATPEVFDLKTWLDTFLEDYRSQWAKDLLFIEVRINPPNLTIRFDKEQLCQILTNLCDNGLRYSFNLTNQYQLLINAGIDIITKSHFLDIIDFGPGVELTQREQIFESFYTSESQGTGLGLYVARELCEINQAQLYYVDTPGQGACFRILLPTF